MPEQPSTHYSRTAREQLKRATGVVIPVYLREGDNRAQAESLLEDTLQAFVDQLDDPGSVCLAVDGRRYGAETAAALAKRYGASLAIAEENRGKLQGVSIGIQHLLPRTSLRFFAVVDQDGDHFANELLNFIRAAQHITVETGKPGVLVIGRRISRHRPMGFLRGELEELADRVLLDALQYRAAVNGRPLDLGYLTALDEFPDFHSGYKLYTRQVAQEIFPAEPALAGFDEEAHWRHAVEVVPIVEALERGAVLGGVSRSTFNQQPVTTFGQLDRSRLIADKIIWPCQRLEIPTPFVRQWMLNHLPRLLLDTLAPEGQRELQQVFRLVMQAFGEDDGPPKRGPLFV